MGASSSAIGSRPVPTGRSLLVAKAKAKARPKPKAAASPAAPSVVGSRVRVRSRGTAEAAAVAARPQADRWVGDISVAAPVMEVNAADIKRLYVGSLLVVLTHDAPTWLEADDERSAFVWRMADAEPCTRGSGGPPGLRLAFAARISVVREISVVGQGSGEGGAVKYVAVQFTYVQATAGFETFTIGVVLVRGLAGAGSREFWREVAECMCQNAVRLVLVIAEPQTNVREHARRLAMVTRAAMESSAVAESSEVRHVAAAYGEPVQVLALGRVAGFDGPLATPSAVAEGRMPHSAWRRESRTEPASVRGTVDHLLPPAIAKYQVHDPADMEGAFFSVWFRGDDRRSAAGDERRRNRQAARMVLHRGGRARQRGTGRGDVAGDR